MYKEDYDPEGLFSTLPAIATSLMGIFTGLILLSKRTKKELLLFENWGSFSCYRSSVGPCVFLLIRLFGVAVL